MDFLKLCEYFEKITSTSKRLEKTKLISELLVETPNEFMDRVVILLQGRVFQVWDNRKLGISTRQVINTIKTLSSKSLSEIEGEWKRTGDLGITAQNLLESKQQKTLFNQTLSLKEIFDSIVKLSSTIGENSTKIKIGIISNMYSNISGLEAKYLTRILLENMQIGIGPGTIRDAIIWAFLPKIYSINYNLSSDFLKQLKEDSKKNKKTKDEMKREFKIKVLDKLVESKLTVLEVKSIEEFGSNYIHMDANHLFYSDDEVLLRQIYNYYVEKINYYYQLTNQYSKIIKIIKTKGFVHLDEIKLEPGNPMKVMLFLKAKNIKDALDNVGSPAVFEYKYDGFRIQIHKKSDTVKLFTRQFEDVTLAFPDLVKAVNEHIKTNECILDCEVVGLNKNDPNKVLPFQEISKRIKRKHDIDQLVEEIPVRLYIFDITEHEGNNLLNTSFEERREILEQIIENSNSISLSNKLLSGDEKEIQEFYNNALSEGHEGLMAKSLSGIYKPGNRVGYGMKIKPTMEPLDLVIVGATWGEGKRNNTLTSFILACKDENDNLLEIGRVGTGFKELEGDADDDTNVSFSKMSELLKPHIIKEDGKEILVEPVIVIEVNYEEIQKSPKYSSGFALRFPRFSRLKTDRDGFDISSLVMIEKLFNQQN